MILKIVLDHQTNVPEGNHCQAQYNRHDKENKMQDTIRKRIVVL